MHSFFILLWGGLIKNEDISLLRCFYFREYSFNFDTLLKMLSETTSGSLPKLVNQVTLCFLQGRKTIGATICLRQQVREKASLFLVPSSWPKLSLTNFSSFEFDFEKKNIYIYIQVYVFDTTLLKM